MREKWTPITRNTKRLYTINFSLKHHRQDLNQKINRLGDYETKRDDEMQLCAENNESGVV